jgi:hypothetical protein
MLIHIEIIFKAAWNIKKHKLETEEDKYDLLLLLLICIHFSILIV